MIFWIETIENCLIGISARPKGFEDLEKDIQELKGLKIKLIISLLDDGENLEFGLDGEKSICEQNNIEFENLAIKDMSVPGFERFVDCVNNVYLKLKQVEKLMIHCNHGQGRSGLFVAGILIRNGMSLKDALKLIESKRGFQCPSTSSQLKFLKAYESFLINT